MKRLIFLALLGGCQERHEHISADTIRYAVMMAVRDQMKTEVHNLSGQVHRYELNMNLLKIPTDPNQPVTVRDSIFTSQCSDEQLQMIQQWLKENVERHCADRSEVEEPYTGTAVIIGENP